MTLLSKTMNPPLIHPTSSALFSLNERTSSPAMSMIPNLPAGRTARMVAFLPRSSWNLMTSLTGTSETPSPYVRQKDSSSPR